MSDETIEKLQKEVANLAEVNEERAEQIDELEVGLANSQDRILELEGELEDARQEIDRADDLEADLEAANEKIEELKEVAQEKDKLLGEIRDRTWKIYDETNDILK